MANNFTPPNKQVLELDLKELGIEICKELFLASRMVSLDTQGYSKKAEVCEKPLIYLRKLFRLRSYFDLHLYRRGLYCMGMLMEEKVFIRRLKSELSRLSLGSVYVYSQVSLEELMVFLKRLGKKPVSASRKFNLQRFLEEKRVHYIRIKESETEDPFIEESISFVNKSRDFKVRTLAKLALQESPQLIQEILSKEIKKDIDLEGRVRFDFRLGVFQSVLAVEPEFHNQKAVDAFQK